MTSMDILTPAEIAFGDSFFTDSNVQHNRAIAGYDTEQKLVDSDGVITAFGLEYTKVLTKYGEVYIPWQVTGSAKGLLSPIYDFIGIGVPVSVCANRNLKGAYPWCGTSMRLDVCSKTNSEHMSYDTRLFSGFDDNNLRFSEWTQWCGNTSKEVGKFIGKGGWNLRKLLEDNNIDNTHFEFYDECDGEKTLYVFTMHIHKLKVQKLIRDSLMVSNL